MLGQSVAVPPHATQRSLGAEILQRLRFATAQIWVRRSRTLLDPIDILPIAAELGAGFQLIDQRRWRTGISKEMWAIRARRAGSVTAWRSFSDGGRRGIWIQAFPVADEEDAKSPLGNLWSGTLRNLRFRGRLLETRPGPKITSLGSDSSTMEQDVAMGDHLVTTRYVAWRKGSLINALAATGPAKTWTWDDIARLAEAQNLRVANAADRAAE